MAGVGFFFGLVNEAAKNVFNPPEYQPPITLRNKCIIYFIYIFHFVIELVIEVNSQNGKRAS